MWRKLLSDAENFLVRNKSRRTWRKTVTGLACVVVFCTTYAMILPAVTLDSDQTLDCSYSVHAHTEDCYDEDGNLICDLMQAEEHIHMDDCSSQLGADDHALTEADPTVVVKAVVWLTGEDAVFSDSGQVMALMSSVSPYAQSASGDIADHLTSAWIEINGEPYDGESALDPGAEFAVALQWQLKRNDLEGTRTYTYQLPSQIHVENVAETVLYDDNNN